MKKSLEEMVWPQSDYTKIIHDSVRETFRRSPCVAFTYPQLRESVLKMCQPWLVLDTKYREQVLHKIVSTGVRKYIQLNLVVECSSKLSTEKQWVWSEYANELGYKKETSNLEVAQSEEAIRSCLNRSLSNKKLAELNHH